jgi:predicted ATPase
MEALYSLARYHLKRGDNGRAQSYAQGQLALEPWCEEAHCQLMRALAASGQRSTALAQYQTCRRLLGDELGIEPATETVRLYESIRAGAFTPPVPSPESVTAPVFVGRAQELDRLDAILDEVLAGRGRGALVGGEAGSGKTALACEFSRQATERYVNLVVAVGHCFAPIGIGDPYSPFREILGQLTGDVGAVGPTGIGAGENAVRLLSLAPAAYAALLGRGPDIIGHLIPGPELLARAAALALQDTAPSGWKRQLEERVASSNGDRMQQGNLFQQVAAVLRALASRWPLLLVVEDLHWADTLSLGLFIYLSQQISSSRILLLGTYRPEEAASGAHGSDPLRSVLSELKRAYGETEVDLDLGAGRGAKQAVAAQCPECEFIDALLDVQPNRLDESFRQALVALTAGHPLFATELLREMRERGELRLDRDGYWVADPNLQWSHLPARLQGVIEQRLERLSPGLLAALRVGSVEGVEFTAEMVARVQGLSDQRLIRRLSVEAVRRHRLLAAPRLQWAGSRPLSRYRFRIPLVREYLYQTLDEAERLYLHGAVRRALAQLYGDQSDQIAAQLARRTQTDEPAD